jgi:translocator protein
MNNRLSLRTPSWRGWIWPPLVLATAVLGGLGSREAQSVYGALHQAAWAPPPALFGPVWTLLYLLMAVAATWVARSSTAEHAAARRQGLWLFAVALLPNALWSWCFFAWLRADWAMVCILLMLMLLAPAAYCFAVVQRAAGWLLMPLLAWVSFAGVLNADLLLRNGSRLLT